MLNGTTRTAPTSVNNLFNSNNFLRRQRRTREQKEIKPSRILSDEEPINIYNEYKKIQI